MQVTLKRAAELSRAAIEAGNHIVLQPELEISIFVNRPVAEVMSAARDELFESVADVQKLLIHGYQIRETIGATNKSIGVDALLSQHAALEALDKRLNPLVARDAHNMRGETDPETLANSIEGGKSSDRYMLTTVTANLMNKAMIEAIATDLAKVKRARSDLRDKIASLNLTTLVDLSDETVEVLRSHKLLD